MLEVEAERQALDGREELRDDWGSPAVVGTVSSGQRKDDRET